MINTHSKDLAPERLDKIAHILREHHVVRVQELCDSMGVSPATVRRDLTEMEARGLIRKVHGGAVAVDARLDEPLFDDKTAVHVDEKQRIAHAALDLIGTHDSIFLDGGSTVLALAALLGEMRRLTVVTNSLRVASALSGSKPRVIVIGGELRALSETFVGPLTGLMIEKLHVDTAFMGTIGLSLGKGLTTTDPREAYTKQRIIESANRVVLMADSSKVNTVSFVGFSPVSGVDTLITDSAASTRDVQAFRKANLTVTTV
ncbi:MAG: DeoR/GlpR transcriptional regulator [Verrucomicrobia bacterium]|jgi:DeoR family transcriptional regulator, fructose operon transcriptional repressor|nr:DeoR/GlpR transcriptional regulator [Verrucomicrobiota bacterium]MBT7066853.1 DeoR/GlpR transcriptional regulator [Verrucomicrobiota bacterium]MBT7700361.1 DeoR/GlpR transcriptional regulator [Verrucomicrobiota bacterium]